MGLDFRWQLIWRKPTELFQNGQTLGSAASFGFKLESITHLLEVRLSGCVTRLLFNPEIATGVLAIVDSSGEIRSRFEDGQTDGRDCQLVLAVDSKMIQTLNH